MRISQDGINLIEEFEGCSLTAYQDIDGTWTIGYGHTQNVCAGTTITQAQANQMLAEDLVIYGNWVSDYVTVSLTQHQYDALVSFTYNLGPGTLQRSDLLSVLNAGQYANAADMFVEYDEANGVVIEGLKRRRLAERALFLAPDPPPSNGWMAKLMNWLFVG